jgi:hypothetical protein
MPPPPTTTH